MISFYHPGGFFVAVRIKIVALSSAASNERMRRTYQQEWITYEIRFWHFNFEHFTRLDCWTMTALFSVECEPYWSTDVSWFSPVLHWWLQTLKQASLRQKQAVPGSASVLKVCFMSFSQLIPSMSPSPWGPALPSPPLLLKGEKTENLFLSLCRWLTSSENFEAL